MAEVSPFEIPKQNTVPQSFELVDQFTALDYKSYLDKTIMQDDQYTIRKDGIVEKVDQTLDFNCAISTYALRIDEDSKIIFGSLTPHEIISSYV